MRDTRWNDGSPRPRRTGAWIRGSEHGAAWEYTANPERASGEMYEFPPHMTGARNPFIERKRRASS